MIILEIAHPNDVAAQKWRKVDKIAYKKEIAQYLSSPSFDHEIGTCVRARNGTSIIYSGIFTKDACVDVGPKSDFIDREWSNATSTTTPNVYKMDLFDRYVNIQGAELFEGIMQMVSDEDDLRALSACASLVFPYLPASETLPMELVGFMQTWLATPSPMENQKEIKKIYTLSKRCKERQAVIRDFGGSNVVEIYSMAVSLASSIDNGEESFHALIHIYNTLTDMHSNERSLMIGNKIREAIPFHIVAQGVVNISDYEKDEDQD